MKRSTAQPPLAASILALALAACGAPAAPAVTASSSGEATLPKSADQRCAAGDAGGCADAADALRTVAPAGAAALYSTACDRGSAYGCARGAALVQSTDPARAFAMLKVACDGGFDASCNDLGLAAERGLGTPIDLPLALSLYTSTCGRGAAYGCFNQGVFVESGKGGATQDDAEAARLYRRSCELGYDHACAALGRLTWLGRGVSQDRDAGSRLLHKSCANGYAYACSFIDLRGVAPPRP